MVQFSLLLTRLLQWPKPKSVVCQSLKEAAAYMSDYSNQSCRAIDVTVGLFAWLSTSHLHLPAKLSQKLAAKWAGPFRVVL